MKSNSKKIIFVGIAAVLLIVLAKQFFFANKAPGIKPRSPLPEPQNTYEAVNGVKVSKETSSLRPLAVMVENHPDSWPQSGLSQADVVYEALAEGGITRFLALYQSNEASTIGPVRSAREYYAQIADEWGALYAHVGGSNEVIAQIKNGVYKNLDDANEYYNFDFFPRRKNKPEPHHIFTSTEKLRELIRFHGFSNAANYQPWEFKEDSPAATSTAEKISIDFSRAGYEVGWEYDQATNAYKRLQYFKPALDEASGRQISAKTVVIQIVKVTPVPRDPLLSVDIDLTSGGRALVFKDGTFIESTWAKQGGRTRFFDASNNEIKFNRGPLWIELVPKDKELNIKIQ
jgi:hypothetical protein